MKIREATPDDAVEACQILRRSIIELCHADHRGDPEVLGGWLRSKTPDNVRSWIVGNNSHVFVATKGNTILAVGAVTPSGEVNLNYVSPDARFAGVSKALLNHLEAKAIELGNQVCTLTSTETARKFYLSAGYKEHGLSRTASPGHPGYRMIKQLSPIVG